MTRTPGPWIIKHTTNTNDFAIRVQETGKGIAMVKGKDNACIIAAAPELLEALQFARALMVEQGWCVPGSASIAIMDAAIAKATGEQK